MTNRIIRVVAILLVGTLVLLFLAGMLTAIFPCYLGPLLLGLPCAVI